MEREQLNRLLVENMKPIFGYALTRLGNVREAEELTSDILLRLLQSADRLEADERFFGFLWKTAEHAYYEFLREKSRERDRNTEYAEEIAADPVTPEDALVRQEELGLLRRELSLLSERTRRATVLYYLERKSCSDIASILDTSTETVKYCLFRARNIIREGMNMERILGEKSYRPHAFEIDFWGTKGGEDGMYRAFRQRKIKGNILLTAYYAPVTAQEISLELGVALPYLEDEIRLLEEKQYLIRKKDKFITNIPIFTEECEEAITDRLREPVKEAAERFSALSGGFEERYGIRFANENLLRWQKVTLASHGALNAVCGEELPEDGPYALVNGGGGRGVIWARSAEDGIKAPDQIQGIYDGYMSRDSRGWITAINYAAVSEAQDFSDIMLDPIVAAACGGFSCLGEDWQTHLEAKGYTVGGLPNFMVYEREEFDNLESLLNKEIDCFTALFRKAVETGAAVCGDMAPPHIKKTAEIVGGIVTRFTGMEKICRTLFETGWLRTPDRLEKPAMFVVKA